MHHRPTDPCGLARRPSQDVGEPDIYEDWQGLRYISPRKVADIVKARDEARILATQAAAETLVANEELAYRIKERDEARDEARFLKVEKMRLEREVSELKRKLYGNHAQE